jgi:hypothetical protein
MIIRNETDKAEAVDEIQALDLEKPWRVDIVLYRANRSNAQNALLLLWIRVIDDYTGQGVDDLRVIFAVKYLGSTAIEIDGKNIIYPKSTSSLNSKEFTDYLNQIERFAHEMGLTLPHPDDLFHEAMGR